MTVIATENTVENTVRTGRTRGLKSPWKKGVKQKPGPGRPKTRKFVAFVRQQYEENPSPQNMERLLKQMEKKCPQEIAHYLAGKPVETVLLGGEKDASPIPVSVIEAAVEAAKKL